MQREIANFLASGKNYFYTISYLLMNQAHISKGVRVESFNASLQGVLEICRTNPPPCICKPLIKLPPSQPLRLSRDELTSSQPELAYPQNFRNNYLIDEKFGAHVSCTLLSILIFLKMNILIVSFQGLLSL